jgi:hypothetical protein
LKNVASETGNLRNKVLRFVLRGVFVQKRGNPNACIGVMQVVDEMVFFQRHVGEQTLARRGIEQFFDAAKCVRRTFV